MSLRAFSLINTSHIALTTGSPAVIRFFSISYREVFPSCPVVLPERLHSHLSSPYHRTQIVLPAKNYLPHSRLRTSIVTSISPRARCSSFQICRIGTYNLYLCSYDLQATQSWGLGLCAASEGRLKAVLSYFGHYHR